MPQIEGNFEEHEGDEEVDPWCVATDHRLEVLEKHREEVGILVDGKLNENNERVNHLLATHSSLFEDRFVGWQAESQARIAEVLCGLQEVGGEAKIAELAQGTIHYVEKCLEQVKADSDNRLSAYCAEMGKNFNDILEKKPKRKEREKLQVRA